MITDNSPDDVKIPGTPLRISPPRGFILDSAQSRLVVSMLKEDTAGLKKRDKSNDPPAGYDPLVGTDTANSRPVKDSFPFRTTDPDANIVVGYQHNVNFKENMVRNHRYLDSSTEAEGRLYYSKEFRVNDAPSLLYYYFSKAASKDVLYLIVGDEDDVFTAKAVFAPGSVPERKAILRSLLTLHRDLSFLDTTGMPFTMDFTGSDYELFNASISKGIYRYIARNYSTNAGNAFIDVYYQDQETGMRQKENTEELMNFYLYKHNEKLEVESGDLRQTITSRGPIYYFTLPYKFQGKKGIIYGRTVGDKSHVYSFVAFLSGEVDKQLKEAQQIASTFRLR